MLPGCTRPQVWEAPRTVLGLVAPEWSLAHQRGLLTHTDEVALVRGGLRVVELEIEIIRGAQDKLRAELKSFDDPANAGRLLWPFRNKCFDFSPAPADDYQFCPYRENKHNGRSLGKYTGWARLRNGTYVDTSMRYHGGDAAHCAGHASRSSTVDMVCAEAYGLLEVLDTGGCHVLLTFGSPVACTAAALAELEAALSAGPR